MSRIGKKAVPVPAGVTATINGQQVSVKGPKGELKAVLNEFVLVKMQADGVKVDPKDQTKLARSSWGLSRTLVSNMVVGVTTGYSKTLENHKHSVAIMIAHFNFCRVHSSLGKTPAVESELSDHTWTVAELLKVIGML